MSHTAQTPYHVKYGTVSDEEALGQAIARYAQRSETLDLFEHISKLLKEHGGSGKLGQSQ